MDLGIEGLLNLRMSHSLLRYPSSKPQEDSSYLKSYLCFAYFYEWCSSKIMIIKINGKLQLTKNTYNSPASTCQMTSYHIRISFITLLEICRQLSIFLYEFLLFTVTLSSLLCVYLSLHQNLRYV